MISIGMENRNDLERPWMYRAIGHNIQVSGVD